MKHNREPRNRCKTRLLSTWLAWCPCSSDVQTAPVLTGLCSCCFDCLYFEYTLGPRAYGNLVHAKCCTSIQWLRMIYFTHIVRFFKNICLMWTIFKVFIEFVTILPLFHVLAFWPRGMWEPSSLTRDGTRTPCTGRQSLSHWTAREVPISHILLTNTSLCIR